MKVVHIVPGSGGTFYCQNCLRDSSLVLALRELGEDVLLAPMYLPLFTDTPELLKESPVFYGAINVYLKERVPVYRKVPKVFQRIMDSFAMLKMAAKKSYTTKASGLEDLTISVLKGEEGNQYEALDEMVGWLRAEEQPPDLIHISNALLLGLVPKLKRELGVPIVCSLQDEDTWVATMEKEAIKETWNLMKELAGEVDCFIGVSQYYADKMADLLSIPKDKIRVVPVGMEMEHYSPRETPADPPTIGYISKMSEQYGLDILIDAFIELKQEEEFSRLRLRATGGMTEDVQEFLERMRHRLGEHQILSDVDFVPHFELKDRVNFLHTLTALSVPVPGGEAFGIYMIEAMACGVPVIQPDAGAFPEVVKKTGGGIIYSPNTSAALAESLRQLLRNPERLELLGKHGRNVVTDIYDIKNIAEQMRVVYKEILHD